MFYILYSQADSIGNAINYYNLIPFWASVYLTKIIDDLNENIVEENPDIENILDSGEYGKRN